MNRKELLWFLGLEILAIVWAGAVFKIFESRLMAGAMAGSYFLFVGLFLSYRILKWPGKWTSPTWYFALTHLFVISLPMLITRFMNADLPFESVKILGLEGPVFHKLSTAVFSGLLLSTLIDLGRVIGREKRRDRGSQSL